MISNKKSLLALSVASALALSGCFSDDDDNVVVVPPDPTDPVIVIEPPTDIVTEQPAKIFSVNVVDIADADVLVGATVRFLVNGEPATNITDVNGEDISMVTVDETGNFTFLSKEGASGEITAVVASEGYVGKSFVIDLNTEVDEGANDIPVQLALLSLDTDGIAEASAEATLEGAITSAPIEAKADNGGAKSNVTVAANTTLKDANGDPISGGNVTLKVLAADSSNANSGSVIPEGLNSNSTTDVAQPLGVANINMSAGETKIKQFDPAIDVSVVLPADSGVDVNDTLDLASHNEDTGVWQQETNKATVTSVNTDGSYNASFQTDHLTFFSLNRNVPVCQSAVVVNVVNGEVPQRGLAISIVSSDGNIGSYIARGRTSKTVIPAASVVRFGISSNATARVRLHDYSGRDYFNSNTEVEICGNIDVSLSNSVEQVQKDFVINGVCQQDNSVSVDLSGSIVTYAKDGKAASIASASGSSTFRLADLEVGGNYRVRATVRGARVSDGGQSQVFTFENIANNTDALTGQVEVQCNERPVTGA